MSTHPALSKVELEVARVLWARSVMLLLAIMVCPRAVMVSAQDQAPAASPPTPVVHAEPVIPRVDSAPDAAPDQTVVDAPRPARQEAEPPILRVYEIQELIDKASKQIGNGQDAERRLLGMLSLGGDDPLRRDLSIRVDGETVHLGGEELRASIRSGKLYVFDRESIHEQVQKQIESLKKHGFEIVRVQTCLMLVPAEKWSELGISWKPASKPLEQASGDIGQGFNGSTPPSVPAIAQPAAHPAAQPAVTPARSVGGTPREVAPAPAILPALDFNPVRQASAVIVFQETPSLLITILDSDPSREIVAKIPGTTVLTHPQIVTLNGVSATVEVSQLTPMTVAYKTKKNGAGDSGVKEAIVEQVQVGTRMDLRPVLVDGRYVHLDFDLSVSRIDNLNQVRQSLSADAEAPPEALQRLATNTIRSTLNVPLGAVLAIGGTSVEQDGKPYCLLCTVRCDKLDDSQQLAP